jgi:membrane-bound lytic murein transglycosylase D
MRIFYAWGCLLPLSALGGDLPTHSPDPRLFPVSAGLYKRVHFWEKVFFTYPEHVSVIHDRENPNLVIDILNFHMPPFSSRPLTWTREQLVVRYLKRYAQAAERFRLEGTKAMEYGAIERRLYEVYGKNPDTRLQLMEGLPVFRSQKGLAGTFLQAAQRAQAYIPLMEQIFQKQGLSPLLPRLAFVESMFEEEAHSSVGALGVWQFMEKTARQFMTINKFIDERLSPLRATHSAALLLAQNYKAFSTWPLAITAYNFGRGNLQDAVDSLHTSEIDPLLTHYHGPGFGFAGRNFYAEFVAACNVYARLQMEGKIQERDSVPALTMVYPTDSVTISNLLKKTPLTQELLQLWNPGLKHSAFTEFRHDLLPPTYGLIFPRSLLSHVKKAFRGMESAGFL